MIVNERKLKRLCSDYERIENYQKAIDSPEKWVCHHRKETDENISMNDLIKHNLYYHRPPEELIFMTAKSHTQLHWCGRHHSIESKMKMSEAKKGSIGYWNGKHHTEETKHKISERKKGKMIGEKHPSYNFICPALLGIMSCERKLSANKISKELKVSRNSILRKLRRFNFI